MTKRKQAATSLTITEEDWPGDGERFSLPAIVEYPGKVQHIASPTYAENFSSVDQAISTIMRRVRDSGSEDSVTLHVYRNAGATASRKRTAAAPWMPSPGDKVKLKGTGQTGTIVSRDGMGQFTVDVDGVGQMGVERDVLTKASRRRTASISELVRELNEALEEWGYDLRVDDGKALEWAKSWASANVDEYNDATGRGVTSLTDEEAISFAISNAGDIADYFGEISSEASRKTAVSANDLNDKVEFYSPFQVNADGTLTTSLPGVYAPSVNDWEGNTGKPEMEGRGWSFVDGFSGQSGYRGPVMHNSEYLGGQMAQYVLDNPGIYALMPVDDIDDLDSSEGWVLLQKDASRQSRKTAATIESGPRDFFPDQLLAQIGRMNILAVSGGRIIRFPNGVRLPVAYGYAVDVFLEADDTYTVQTTFTRSGVTKVKGESKGVYADQVGEAVYQASNYRDLKNAKKAKNDKCSICDHPECDGQTNPHINYYDQGEKESSKTAAEITEEQVVTIHAPTLPQAGEIAAQQYPDWQVGQIGRDFSENSAWRVRLFKMDSPLVRVVDIDTRLQEARASKTAAKRWVVLQRGTFVWTAGPFDTEAEAQESAAALNSKWNTNEYLPMAVNATKKVAYDSAFPYGFEFTGATDREGNPIIMHSQVYQILGRPGTRYKVVGIDTRYTNMSLIGTDLRLMLAKEDESQPSHWSNGRRGGMFDLIPVGTTASVRKTAEHRPIYEIAAEIKKEWGGKVNYAAAPYLDAMMYLNSISDRYMMDSASSVVAYFLSNASSFRGEKAKELKAELKAMLKTGSKAGASSFQNDQVEVSDDTEPMWPWEIEGDEGGDDAADVADVHTPGQSVGDYPQPTAVWNQNHREAAADRFATAGEGAYVTDQYDSGWREEVEQGTHARGILRGHTMFGPSYSWEVEGLSGDNWNLGGEWFAYEHVEATRQALNEQSGHAESSEDDVEVGDENDRPMWPWEIGLIEEGEKEASKQADFFWQEKEPDVLDPNALLPEGDRWWEVTVQSLIEDGGFTPEEADEIAADALRMQFRRKDSGGTVMSRRTAAMTLDEAWEVVGGRGTPAWKILNMVRPANADSVWVPNEYDERRYEAVELILAEGDLGSTVMSARSDYDHWNEDADRMWWAEEGQWAGREDPPDPYDDYDNPDLDDMGDDEGPWLDDQGRDIEFTSSIIPAQGRTTDFRAQAASRDYFDPEGQTTHTRYLPGWYANYARRPVLDVPIIPREERGKGHTCSFCGSNDVVFTQAAWSDDTNCNRCGGYRGYPLGD